MKQILQHLRSGEMKLEELPCPQAGRGQLLIQTRASLISAGTERMLVEFSQGNLLQKARSQPEKVKQVLDKMRPHPARAGLGPSPWSALAVAFADGRQAYVQTQCLVRAARGVGVDHGVCADQGSATAGAEMNSPQRAQRTQRKRVGEREN